MSDRKDQREALLAMLAGFGTAPLADAARSLFATLGYQSDRRLAIATANQFCERLDPHGKLTDREREALAPLQALHLLFQLTDAELQAHGADMFEDSRAVDGTRIESYLFFAAELPPGPYTRTALSTLVRAINKPLPMPALVLFRHGDAMSLGIIHRRLHKRDGAKDVLEKVTLIKDIACADPIRAHIEILNDFALANLDADFGVSNFVRLHEAWQNRLGSYALSNDFYREVADWYFWAHHQVNDGAIRLPQHCDTEQEKSLFLIRLLTRVIFSWFLVEKRLIPTDLFRPHRVQSLLKDFKPSRDPSKPDTASTYYHAILQNLFFGTLNMPPEQRAFRERKKDGERYDSNFGITNLWRYEGDFRQPADWLALAARVPFLNGGLFDCLDDKSGKKKGNVILDGFSDRKDFGCDLPNDLFFGPERTVDLSKDYGEEDKRTARSKKAKVRGLIEILSRYKFTIEENTPLEEEIALDPELLGKVFENLLASYNEDTRTTARKALGAFYTPREIVSYMVDEALKSYLTTQVPRCKGALEDLFSNKATLHEIKPDTRDALIAAIGRVKILDPACGSGAFPMGALQRLVDLLQKLDPNNESWKRDRLAEARRYRKLLEESSASQDEIGACDARIADIEKSFDTRFHALDFARKLYLIENSIYGVDIQPIATQIAKLRFFISLVVDQKVQGGTDNPVCARGGNPQTRLSVLPFNREAPILKTHRNLPHWTQDGRTYWVTFRLADSLPASKLQAWQEEKAIWLRHNPEPWNDRQWEEYDERFGRRLEDWLDSGEGECTLRRPDVRALVERCLLHFDGQRYDLPSWVIMPNHVHLLIRPYEGQSLSRILQGIKGVSARECNTLLGRTGQTFWQDESFDHVVRSQAQFERFVRYIADNPRKAKLTSEEFSLSSPDNPVCESPEESSTDNPVCGSPEKSGTDNPVCDPAEKTQTRLSGPPSTQTGLSGPLGSQTRLSGLPWNMGIRPLPNLETKFVAADTLIPIEKSENDLLTGDLDKLRAELAAIRHEHFNARSPAAKLKWRAADEAKRGEIAALLERNHALPKESARKLAAWDPYDQNGSAPFFDSEWMFGLPIGKVRLQAKSSATLLGNLALINEAGGQTELTASKPREIDSGFDIVLGNPPYIRIQTLKQKNPKLVAFLKDHYASAAKGNYDIYVVFIEAGLRLLKSDGHLAYICPHKFFNSEYGEPLRGTISKGGHLRHVVHFGDQQVFPGATIYTCLLFLARAGSAECRMVRAENLEAWKATLSGIEGKVLSSTITSSEWNLAVGHGADIYGRLATMPVKLGDIAEIYVGLQTSADTVFLFKDSKRSSRKLTKVQSKESGEEVEIETALLKSVVRSGELGRYWATPSALVLFPYEVEDGRFQLIASAEMAERFPTAWAYLKSHKKLLSEREHGRFAESGWWQLYPKNLDQWEQAKIMVPYMITDLAAYYDSGGTYFVNVTTGGFGITTHRSGRNLEWLTVLLNSQLLDWFLKKVSTTFHGGYFAANKQFLVQLPIADCGAENQESAIRLSRWLHHLKSRLVPTAQTTRDPLMLAYWERVLNGLVYELYFPEEVHGAGLRLFDLVEAAHLPSVEQTILSVHAEPGVEQAILSVGAERKRQEDTDKIVCATLRQKLDPTVEQTILSVHAEGKSQEHTDKIVCAALRRKFEELHDGAHPLRIALDKLQTLDTVRIIEGKA